MRRLSPRKPQSPSQDEEDRAGDQDQQLPATSHPAASRRDPPLTEQPPSSTSSVLLVPSTQSSTSTPPSAAGRSLPILERLSSHLAGPFRSTAGQSSPSSLPTAHLPSLFQQPTYSSPSFPSSSSLPGTVSHTPSFPDRSAKIEKQDPKKEPPSAAAASGPEMSTSSGTVGAGSSESFPSLRGAPDHMRQEIIRRQNVEYQRRTRERRRAAYRNLVDQHRVQIEEITRLEARVAALIRILEDAGIKAPDVVLERMGDTEADDGRRLLAELETYIDEYNRTGEGQPFGDED